MSQQTQSQQSHLPPGFQIPLSPILANRKFIQVSRRLVTGQWLPIASFAYHQHASIYLTALIAIDPAARINYRIDQAQEVNL